MVLDWFNEVNCAGRCLAKHLVCLVIDEAHRALGNYASSGAVREVCCSISFRSVLIIVYNCYLSSVHYLWIKQLD